MTVTDPVPPPLYVIAAAIVPPVLSTVRAPVPVMSRLVTDDAARVSVVPLVVTTRSEPVALTATG